MQCSRYVFGRPPKPKLHVGCLSDHHLLFQRRGHLDFTSSASCWMFHSLSPQYFLGYVFVKSWSREVRVNKVHYLSSRSTTYTLLRSFELYSPRSCYFFASSISFSFYFASALAPVETLTVCLHFFPYSE
jgi:hypothetical protein